MGAELCGYALSPPISPSLYELAGLEEFMPGVGGDVRNLAALTAAMSRFQPHLVFHLAAQALVRPSYEDPLDTYAVNVMGTAHLLEAVRRVASVRAVVVVTSDKCYDNREWIWPYRECEPLGGYDPYSSSKACAEILTASFRRSFFRAAGHAAGVATVRAGNVIGGGDWNRDRLLPDCFRALVRKEEVLLRNPHAVRPWQHVLDALAGYLGLAERLAQSPGFAEAWNFGPEGSDTVAVEELVRRVAALWGRGASWRSAAGDAPHEAQVLRLDSSKARDRLGWRPRWDLDAALRHTVEWYQAWAAGANMRDFSLQQIAAYQGEGAVAEAAGGAA